MVQKAPWSTEGGLVGGNGRSTEEVGWSGVEWKEKTETDCGGEESRGAEVVG